jgi:hypothetical protein
MITKLEPDEKEAVIFALEVVRSLKRGAGNYYDVMDELDISDWAVDDYIKVLDKLTEQE